MKRFAKGCGCILLCLILLMSVAISIFGLRVDLSNSYDPKFSSCAKQIFNGEEQSELMQQMAVRFWPVLFYVRGDFPDDSGFAALYQVISLDEDEIEITISFLYPRDYGSTISITLFETLTFSMVDKVDAHKGDVETLRIHLLKLSGEENVWIIDRIRVKQHTRWTTYYPGKLQCIGGQPVFYVSRGKHAMYASIEQCLDSGPNGHRVYQVFTDYCEFGQMLPPENVLRFDVGTRQNKIDPLLIDQLAEWFPNESAWNKCFYGGIAKEENDDCRAKFYWK